MPPPPSSAAVISCLLHNSTSLLRALVHSEEAISGARERNPCLKWEPGAKHDVQVSAPPVFVQRRLQVLNHWEAAQLSQSCFKDNDIKN